MPVAVVTDSAADLDESQAAELGVTVVPLSIRFGAEEFVDRRDLTPTEFYERLAASAVLPETAAPSPGAFEQAFRNALASGADAVVCINISTDLSGTMQAAQAAARSVDGADIRVLDSRSVTWGEGSQVVAAATRAASGATADEVEALVADMRRRTHVYGALDTLENLKKGGRIGNAQALLGSLLSIKPIIDVSTGIVEEAGKVRTRSKALRALVDRVAAAGAVENLAVMHANAPDVDELVGLLAEHHPREQIHIGIIGATVGVHGGPRVTGVTFQTC
ncbi:MAG: DegV family protein [Acidobacteria bacterium]|nr:DegV family protein [Acidobacteriota bacterium]